MEVVRNSAISQSIGLEYTVNMNYTKSEENYRFIYFDIDVFTSIVWY